MAMKISGTAFAAFMVFGLACASCRCNGEAQTDAGEDRDMSDLPEDATVDSVPDHGDSGDSGEDLPEEIDAAEMPPEVFHELAPLTPDRPGMECGECCRQVTFLDASVHSYEYDVWGDWLVCRTINDRNDSNGIWLVDLNTLTYYNVETTWRDIDERKYCTSPAIYNNKIIYDLIGLLSREPWITNEKMMYFDFVTGERTDIYQGEFNITEGEWGLGQIHFNDEYVVWQENRQGGGGMQEIFLMNIDTREERELSQADCCSLQPRIWDNRVVWFEYWPGVEVFIYDITADTTAPADTYESERWKGAVWEDIVVWFDSRNGGTDVSPYNSDVYMKDLATGEITQVTTDPNTQCDWLEIHNNIVVWSDKRNSLSPHTCATGSGSYFDVYAKNLATGEERNLTPFEGNVEIPKVWGKRAFFMWFDGVVGKQVFAVDLECLGFLR